MRKLSALLPVLVACVLNAAPAPVAPIPQDATTPDLPHSPGSWSMIVVPDIQSYVDHAMYTPILNEMMDWIVANREQLNIQLVLQEGDIVYQNGVLSAEQSSGDQNSAQQWSNARAAFRKLDGVLPYVMAPGNHDFGISNADNRSTQFTRYFTPQDNPRIDFTQGGILRELGPDGNGDPSLVNAAYAFTAPDGRKLLFLALEFGPRQVAIDWANSVVSKECYTGYTKALLTHAYLYEDGTRFNWAVKGDTQSNNPHEYGGTKRDTHDGQEMWNELVRKYDGFELVFCGHVGGDMVGCLASPNDYGQQVHQMMFNAQFLPQGGQGWLRIVEFLPDGETVHVRTFSPYFALDGDPATKPWRNSHADDFTFRLSPVSSPAGS